MFIYCLPFILSDLVIDINTIFINEEHTESFLYLAYIDTNVIWSDRQFHISFYVHTCQCPFFYVSSILTYLLKNSQEFNIEKLQLVEAEKKKIRQEYERKEKQVEVRKKM